MQNTPWHNNKPEVAQVGTKKQSYFVNNRQFIKLGLCTLLQLSTTHQPSSLVDSQSPCLLLDFELSSLSERNLYSTLLLLPITQHSDVESARICIIVLRSLVNTEVYSVKRVPQFLETKSRGQLVTESVNKAHHFESHNAMRPSAHTFCVFAIDEVDSSGADIACLNYLVVCLVARWLHWLLWLHLSAWKHFFFVLPTQPPRIILCALKTSSSYLPASNVWVISAVFSKISPFP